MKIIDNVIQQLPECDLKTLFEKLNSQSDKYTEYQITRILERTKYMEAKCLMDLALLPVVKSNPEVFDELCKKEDWELLYQLKSALNNEFVVNNKEVLRRMLRQNSDKEVTMLMEALNYDFIRNNLKYFNLIESQEYYSAQYEMLQAVLNEDIRDNEEVLAIIDSYKKDVPSQEQARLHLEKKEIRENMDLFYGLMNPKNDNKPLLKRQHIANA